MPKSFDAYIECLEATYRPIACCSKCGVRVMSERVEKVKVNPDDVDYEIKRHARNCDRMKHLPVGWVSNGSDGIVCSECGGVSEK